MDQQTPPKRLYRTRDDRIIAGVCGGLAKYFNVDPTWIRILFVVLLIFFLATLVIYLFMWLIVPLEPTDKEEITQPTNSNNPNNSS